jgi:hypothetical protein
MWSADTLFSGIEKHQIESKGTDTNPMSSMMVGTAHLAKWAFLLLLTEVASRKTLYILDRPLPDMGLSTARPNMR